MSLQQEYFDKQSKVLINNREERLPDVNKMVEKCWPSYIYPFQKSISYGSIFATITQYIPHGNIVDIQILCKLSTLLINVEAL